MFLDKKNDIQVFDTRTDQALLSASEIPKGNILEGLHKLKIRDPVQIRTVLAMYDQELGVMPSYQRLKTLVSRPGSGNVSRWDESGVCECGRIS